MSDLSEKTGKAIFRIGLICFLVSLPLWFLVIYVGFGTVVSIPSWVQEMQLPAELGLPMLVIGGFFGGLIVVGIWTLFGKVPGIIAAIIYGLIYWKLALLVAWFLVPVFIMYMAIMIVFKLLCFCLYLFSMFLCKISDTEIPELDEEVYENNFWFKLLKIKLNKANKYNKTDENVVPYLCPTCRVNLRRYAADRNAPRVYCPKCTHSYTWQDVLDNSEYFK